MQARPKRTSTNSGGASVERGALNAPLPCFYGHDFLPRRKGQMLKTSIALQWLCDKCVEPNLLLWQSCRPQAKATNHEDNPVIRDVQHYDRFNAEYTHWMSAGGLPNESAHILIYAPSWVGRSCIAPGQVPMTGSSI